MLNKNAALFLAITAWVACLLIIVFRLIPIINSPNETSISVYSWLYFIVLIASYFTLGLFGLTSYKSNENIKRNSAIALAIVGGIWLSFILYEIYDSPNKFDQIGELNGLIDFIRYHILRLLTPLGIMLVGIAFSGDNQTRQRRSFYWLFIGGINFLIADLSYFVFSLYLQTTLIASNSPAPYRSLYMILDLLSVPFSIAIIFFSIKGYLTLSKPNLTNKNKTENETTIDMIEPIDKWEKIRTINVLSPMQWLGNFLMAAIPLAGPVLLAIWASDHQNRIRRNWAIMQFWGVTAGIGLNALLLGSVLELSDSFSGIFAVFVTVFIIMIIIASILTYNYFQQLSNFEDDQNPTLGTWLANFVIIAIPIIGLIMLIVWATDSTKELIKKWAIARLIWIAISLIIVIHLYSTYHQIRSYLSFTYLQF
ncbi:MAG: hypothetical protein QE487_19470 [Fluviicola sp.]|nr:hypothetical protein [Fluviicola sp.]